MIRRTHEEAGTSSVALYSPCERYRYGLARTWDAAVPPVLFIMLNPSTADERRNDPTIHRCERRARDWGYGGVMIANLFAWRATRPSDLRLAAAPEGPENAVILSDWHAEAGRTVAAWGVHGALRGVGPDWAARAGTLSHLGLTKAGHPRHPLYVGYDVTPRDWPLAERYAR
ncbi:DUF1643 domain-containing protein [Roseivivax marinus]|uniref:DUF1643 domain-containing protein n=1 Tax=Roseivivax marinus TaxID=1379903 RepID=UPI00273FE031|nr:DUF1643 domain-containing protein [Roseivivax marinus]